MSWELALLVILGSFVIIMMSGLPVAFCFLIINLVGVFIYFGGEVGLYQLVRSIDGSLTIFILLPIPLFILMGEVMFHSGLAPNMIDALDIWLGRLPGRLGLLAVGAGTLFASLTGVSQASVAMLGSTLVPEMEKRGYKKPMSLGPILGSGGLAIMIPPSSVAVFLSAIAFISVGQMLIAIIIPGLLMAAFYSMYISIRCIVEPHIAPSYQVPTIPFSQKLIALVKYILPVGFIVFLVVGVIFLGIATPSEAAATGAVGTFILTAFYKRLNWGMVKKAARSTTKVTVMMLMLMAGAKAFSQVLAASGATRNLVEFATSLPLAPIFIIIAMQVVLLIMGAFMDVVAMIMITIPLYMPIVYNLGFDPIWFGVLVLLNTEIATTSPPFGLNLFVMKAVAPAETTMGDIYKAALPFIGCDLIVMALLMILPAIVLWLPSLMF